MLHEKNQEKLRSAFAELTETDKDLIEKFFDEIEERIAIKHFDGKVPFFDAVTQAIKETTNKYETKS